MYNNKITWLYIRLSINSDYACDALRSLGYIFEVLCKQNKKIMSEMGKDHLIVLVWFSHSYYSVRKTNIPPA